VILSWSNPGINQSGFIIERSTDGTNFTPLSATITAGQTTFTDTGLSASTPYWYRIHAVFVDGTGGVNSSALGIEPSASANANIATASFASGVNLLSANWDYQGDGTSTQATPNQLILRFDRNVWISPTALQMQNATTGAEITSADYVLTYDPTTFTATYTFPDQTSNLGIAGALSDGWWVATIDQNDIISADGTLHLNSNVTINCPILTADAYHTISYNAAGEAQMTVNGADYNLVMGNFDATGQTYAQGAFTYNGIVGGADYYAVLNDFDATLTAPPSTPGQLSISNDGANPQTALDINWSAPTPPAGLTIDHYELQRSDFTSGGETFTTIASDLTTTQYTDANGTTGLTPGNRYWYRVRAVYSDGSASA
jgi:titin